MAEMTYNSKTNKASVDFDGIESICIDVSNPTEVVGLLEQISLYDEAVELAHMEAMQKFRDAIGANQGEEDGSNVTV